MSAAAIHHRPSSTQRARQRSGALGERVVEQLAEACSKVGLGYLRKRPTAAVHRPGAKPRFTGSAGCDYQGVLKGGRAIALEVKRVSAGVTLPYSALRESQVDELELAYGYGALALVAVVWGPGASRVSVIPWREVRHEVRGDARGSIPLAAYDLRGRLLLEVVA